jgi:hypothetical protein
MNKHNEALRRGHFQMFFFLFHSNFSNDRELKMWLRNSKKEKSNNNNICFFFVLNHVCLNLINFSAKIICDPGHHNIVIFSTLIYAIIISSQPTH